MPGFTCFFEIPNGRSGKLQMDPGNGRSVFQFRFGERTFGNVFKVPFNFDGFFHFDSHQFLREGSVENSLERRKKKKERKKKKKKKQKKKPSIQLARMTFERRAHNPCPEYTVRFQVA
jgi:hypothetical protein